MTKYIPFDLKGELVQCELSSEDGLDPLLFVCVSPLTGGGGVFCRPDELRELADAMDLWESKR